MSRFFSSFFSGQHKRAVQPKFRLQASKKTFIFESLEARRVLYGDSCQIGIPVNVAAPVAEICTALTLEEFTALTTGVADDGVVAKLPIVDGPITQVDGIELVDNLPPNISEILKGDADLDGDVDEADLAAWDENFTGDLGGNLATPAKTLSQGDFDSDGDVDLNDLGLWSQFYTGSPSEEAEPESAASLADEAESSGDEADSAQVESSDFVIWPIESPTLPPILEPIFPGSEIILDPSFTLTLAVNPLAGDADGDSDVDDDDLATWDANFTGDLGGNLEEPVKTPSQGDFDNDGDVDLNDLGLWSETYTGPDDDVAQSEAAPTLAADDAPVELLTSLVVNPTAGDADSDGDIDEDDLATWEANFTGDLGGSELALMTFAQGDFDLDGDVDLNDLGLWSTYHTGPIEIGT